MENKFDTALDKIYNYEESEGSSANLNDRISAWENIILESYGIQNRETVSAIFKKCRAEVEKKPDPSLGSSVADWEAFVSLFDELY